MTMGKAAGAALLIGALALQPAAAASDGQTPAGLADLVGVKGASGEAELEARGYSFIGGGMRDDRKISYWWNGAAKQCVRIATFDGRYESLATTSKADCNQKSGDKGAAVAVGAVALLGAIALMHKSHDHDDGRHYEDSSSEAQYERGYRDGLYANSYHNYDRSSSYGSGYENGVRARGHETGYRGGSFFSGGYGGHVSLSDLNGRDRDGAFDELSNRGFRMRDNKDTGSGHSAVFWRQASRQCVIVSTRHGSVTGIDKVADGVCRD